MNILDYGVKISDLPQTEDFTDNVIPLVQDGATKRVSGEVIKETILGEAKEYTDQTLLAINEWLPPVNTTSQLKTTGLDNKRNYLCKVVADPVQSGVYQAVAGWTDTPQWALFDDTVDLVNEQELEAAIGEHDQSGVAHENRFVGQTPVNTIPIPAGANLDTYLDPGFYGMSLAGNVTSVTGKPSDYYPTAVFSLEVLKPYFGTTYGGRIQRLTMQQSPFTTWTRSRDLDNTLWYPWVKLSSSWVNRTETINTTMAELQATIDRLPKLLLHNVTINVQPGEISTNVTASRFYGPGLLNIYAVNESNVLIATAGTQTHKCNRFIVEYNTSASRIIIQGFTVTDTTTSGFLCYRNSTFVLFNYCNVIGGTVGGGTSADAIGIYVNESGLCQINQATINNRFYAVQATQNANLGISTLLGTGNNVAMRANARGQISISVLGAIEAATLYMQNNGGIIARSDGTFLESVIPAGQSPARPISISSGSLNLIVTPGFYHASSDSSTTSAITDLPNDFPKGSAFALQVLQAYGSTGIAIQRLTVRDRGASIGQIATWERSATSLALNTTWYSWQKLINSSDLLGQTPANAIEIISGSLDDIRTPGFYCSRHDADVSNGSITGVPSGVTVGFLLKVYYGSKTNGRLIQRLTRREDLRISYTRRTDTAGGSWTSWTQNPWIGSTLPQMNGVASSGNSTEVARVNHVHPSDTSKVDEAPKNGGLYGRKDGAWAAVPSGGGGGTENPFTWPLNGTHGSEVNLGNGVYGARVYTTLSSLSSNSPSGLIEFPIPANTWVRNLNLLTVVYSSYKIVDQGGYITLGGDSLIIDGGGAQDRYRIGGYSPNMGSSLNQYWDGGMMLDTNAFNMIRSGGIIHIWVKYTKG